MSGLFSTPKVEMPKPPAAPTVDNSADKLDYYANQAALGRQRGLSATLLTGGYGANDSKNTSRVLLGGK